MNFGFNSNVRVGKQVFHVQTEDRGADHPFIDTVVYQGGRVIHKLSTTYKDLLAQAGDPKAFADLLHARLSDQHKDVIAQVEAGKLGVPVPVPVARAITAVPVIPSAPPKPKPSIDSVMNLVVQLANPASWLAAGNVTLQVNILLGKAAAAGAEVESFFESSNGRSNPCRTTANGSGFAEMKFPMPTALGENTTLVIRATLEDDRGELRFRLKPAKPSPVPAVPVA